MCKVMWCGTFAGAQGRLKGSLVCGAEVRRNQGHFPDACVRLMQGRLFAASAAQYFRYVSLLYLGKILLLAAITKDILGQVVLTEWCILIVPLNSAGMVKYLKKSKLIKL